MNATVNEHTIMPAPPRQVKYLEGDLAWMADYPLRIRVGVYIAVMSGTAVVNTGTDTYRLAPQTELTLTAGCLAQCTDRSGDFRVRLFSFTPELLAKIALPIDRVYFDYNELHPLYLHTPDGRSQRTWRELLLWMDMARMLFAVPGALRFMALQEEDFLQGFWMWCFGTIQERIDIRSNLTGTQLIAHEFIRLVKTEAASHHDVEYYADRLNITRRYLNKIIFRHTRGRTPKQVIDAQLVAEVKEQLMDSSLSATQVAARLGFPDQSYLCRFFSRHTGMSPTQYRTLRSVNWNMKEGTH